MHCPYCQSPLKIKKNYCYHCGHILDGEADKILKSQSLADIPNGFSHTIDGPTAFALCIANKLADFEGRSSRQEFFYFLLIALLLSVFLGFLLQWLIPADIINLKTTVLSLIVTLIYGVFASVLYFALISVTVRRLHDIGKSGLNILWVALPILGWLYIFYLCCKKSEPYHNLYGSIPYYPIDKNFPKTPK